MKYPCNDAVTVCLTTGRAARPFGARLARPLGAGAVRAPECSPEILDVAVTAAHETRESWLADPAARSSALTDIAAIIEKNLEERATLITTEQGKPLHEARDERLVLSGIFATTPN